MAVVLTLSWQAKAILGLAVVFGFLNGLNDAPNIVATIIASHAMRPRTALWLTAIANGVGPFLFGVAVATTIGRELVLEEVLTLPVIGAAVIAAVFWNIVTWRLGIPSSSSHTLVGGIVGAALAAQGWQALLLGGLVKVLAALLISPPLGFAVGYLTMKLIMNVADALSFSPRINSLLRSGQWVTATWLAASHGASDGQKTMGIIAMTLLASGAFETFQVPLWVVAVSAGVIALGTVFGSWRLIKTLGRGLYQVRPIHSFSAQLASTLVIVGAALLGGPISTTQVIGTAIMGAGSAERINQVRWGLIRRIAVSWLLTIPASGAVASILYHVVLPLGG